MVELNQNKPVSLEELVVSTLAMVDAVTKILIEKGVITDAGFKQKLLEATAKRTSGFSIQACSECMPIVA